MQILYMYKLNLSFTNVMFAMTLFAVLQRKECANAMPNMERQSGTCHPRQHTEKWLQYLQHHRVTREIRAVARFQQQIFQQRVLGSAEFWPASLQTFLSCKRPDKNYRALFSAF